MTPQEREAYLKQVDKEIRPKASDAIEWEPPPWKQKEGEDLDQTIADLRADPVAEKAITEAEERERQAEADRAELEDYRRSQWVSAFTEDDFTEPEDLVEALMQVPDEGLRLDLLENMRDTGALAELFDDSIWPEASPYLDEQLDPGEEEIAANATAYGIIKQAVEQLQVASQMASLNQKIAAKESAQQKTLNDARELAVRRHFAEAKISNPANQTKAAELYSGLVGLASSHPNELAEAWGLEDEMVQQLATPYELLKPDQVGENLRVLHAMQSVLDGEQARVETMTKLGVFREDIEREYELDVKNSVGDPALLRMARRQQELNHGLAAKLRAKLGAGPMAPRRTSSGRVIPVEGHVSVPSVKSGLTGV
jgi:hypothetical protein